MARIQRLECKALYIEKDLSLYDKRFYVAWRKDGLLHRSFNKVDKKHNTKTPHTAETAMQTCKDAENSGVFLFAAGPIPANNNQQGVFYYNKAGNGKNIPVQFKKDDAEVTKAYNSVFGIQTSIQTTGGPVKVDQVITVTQPVEVPRIVLGIQYNPHGKEYHVYSNKSHRIGDFVSLNSSDGVVNAKVASVAVMVPADVKNLISEINDEIRSRHGTPIKDLVLVKDDVPCHDASSWAKWNKEDVPQKYWEDFVPVYNSEEEYCENIAELQAMQECFLPAVDHIYPGDLPDPEPDEVWCNEEAEVSDLPE